ncbi:formylglycine-generating enzyme family protein [uncultured Arcticibacterium sp.]|uniref:formylglycine-generating enzyme family protein n=1 Tax=uncultured Arcticibacterium sp. TaxID=2173042 RepID=UPI0030F99003
MKNVLSVLFLGLVILGCNSSEQKEETSEKPSFNPRAELPSTVLYVGLKEPEQNEIVNIEETVPENMIAISGGNVRIGSEEGFAHERPMFWATLKPFFMDKSPVTVGQFRAFVLATDYKTEADKFGNAGIIHESTDKNWILKDGANWEYPLGKDFPKAEDNHPVTQVSWNDATAYAKWAGKRLPHEIEWEHAARNGKNTRDIYAWGNEIAENDKYLANVWQGTFPNFNENTDAFTETSPVGAFGESPIGLTDLSGNVWEWCSNYVFDYRSLIMEDVPSDFKGEKAERGGSFLCEPSWCHGYRVSGRSSSSPETSLFHVGFRCVKDI